MRRIIINVNCIFMYRRICLRNPMPCSSSPIARNRKKSTSNKINYWSYSRYIYLCCCIVMCNTRIWTNYILNSTSPDSETLSNVYMLTSSLRWSSSELQSIKIWCSCTQNLFTCRLFNIPQSKKYIDMILVRFMCFSVYN